MNKNFALGKKNLLWIGIGFIIIVAGFILMTGQPSTQEAYNPDIFSFRRIELAPTVSFIGFIVVLVGILIKPSENKNDDSNPEAVE